MFEARAMVRVSIHLLEQDAGVAAALLAEHGAFQVASNPEPRTVLPDLPAESYAETYQSARVRAEKMLTHFCAFENRLEPPPRPPALAELKALDHWLGEVWAEISAAEEEVRRWRDSVQRIEQQLATLDNFSALDIDLRRLREPSQLLDLRLGTVPSANVARLTESMGLAGYTVARYLEREGQTHLVVAGTRGLVEPIDAVLQAAGWRTLNIPREFQDRPAEVRRQLEQQREHCHGAAESAAGGIISLCSQFHGNLLRALAVLESASVKAQLALALRGRGSLAVLDGWVPGDRLTRLKSALAAGLDHPVLVVERAPEPGDTVPTALTHHRLLAPFEALVKNYGVPRYGEVDPTLILALTFVLMFGMMFGDVGHGLIIAAVGLLLRHRLQGYAPIMVAAGGASVLFGVLYGSVFGHETLIHPLWISPLSDPLLMLRMAMAWGVGFILLATTLTIYNRLREQRWLQALMDGKGVAGIALYAAMIWLLYGWITHGATSAGAVTLLLGSLLSVMAYRWTQIGGPVGEKMLTVLIEGFETVMSYVSGSLSFLRVAAFSLNHVALALAVFAIADTLQGVGQWVVIVLGNLFIIVLEGAIVAIQVMRLEYYEGFSRFFHGDGQEFAPLKRLRVRPSSSATTRADARHQAPGSPTAAL